MTIWYKSVNKNLFSHYDGKTKWIKGRTVTVDDACVGGPCGIGLHASPTLLDTLRYQKGPSRYIIVDPGSEISLGSDSTKSRFRSLRFIREIEQEELDEIAGFKLYEANNPINPLKIKKSPSAPDSQYFENLIRQWASVWASVRDSVMDSVGDSVWASVRDSVWASVMDSVWASVRASVWASVRDSVWDSVRASVRDSAWDSVRAYTGGLFPNIKKWKYVEKLGPDPWRPLLTLWYAGYVPSFDGETWHIHAGPKAKVVFSIKNS